MKTFRTKLITLFALVFLTSSSISFADSAWLGGYGNTPEPHSSESPDIQMVSEVIRLNIHPGKDYGETAKISGWTEIEVSYLFKNHTDQEVTVKMGFPELCQNGGIACDPDLDVYNSRLHDFEAIIDGDELDVEYEKTPVSDNDIEVTHWYTYDVTFEANQERTLVNRYWITDSAYKTGNWTYYILSTGATWKDEIEKIDIEVSFDQTGGIYFTPYDLTNVQPGGFTYNEDKNTINWQLENLEPTEEHDITINYLSPDRVPFECFAAPDETSDQSSSHLPAEIDEEVYEDSLLYYPCQARDNSVNTAWVEGVEGPGIGEWLQIPLYQNKDYSRVWIFNGYGSSQSIWEKNNRVKTAKLTFEGYPEYGQILEFADSDTYGTTEFVLDQTISNSEYAQIEILEVYPGKEFDDTAISEVNFLGLLTNRADSSNSNNDNYDGPFPDIEGHEYEQAIRFAYDMGYVNGHPDGTYKPDDSINRAEFTKIITEATTVALDGEISGENCFPDVQSEWFAKYICHAKKLEVIDGYPDGTFKPGDNVNYVEAMKIIMGAYDEYIPPASDNQEWFEPYIIHGGQIGVNIEVVNDHLLTRGEMAELIRQMFIYLSKSP